MKGHSPTSVWAAIDSVTTTTTSAAKQFAEYDYAEMVVDSEHTTTAWVGSVQVQGSLDGTNFFNYGNAVSAEGMYTLNPLPEWVRIVGAASAGTLGVNLKAVCLK